MDSTIIVLNTNNKLNLQKLADYITQKNIVADVIVASTTKHESVEGINEKVFAENNDDKILNTLIKDVKTEKLVVVRKVENDNFEDIEKFLNGLTENNSICVYKKRNNKFLEYIQKLLNIIAMFMFGYNFYPGNFSIVAFGKNAVEVLRQITNSSLYTKVDKWIGMEFVEIEQTNKIKIRFKPNLIKRYLNILLYSLFVIAPILCWVLIEYVQKKLIIQLLCVISITLAICLIFVEILIIFVKRFVGDNECDIIENDEK